VQWTPTIWFNGIVGRVGYSSQWDTDIQNELARPTDVTIDASAVLTNETLDIDADICIEAGGSSRTMRIYTFQLLDHFPDTETYYRNCFRLVKIQTVTVEAGQCTSAPTVLTINSYDAGRPEDVRVVVVAQEDLDAANAEVYQTVEIDPLIAVIHSTGFEDGNLDDWDWNTGTLK